jgi:hypothetical protein
MSLPVTASTYAAIQIAARMRATSENHGEENDQGKLDALLSASHFSHCSRIYCDLSVGTRQGTEHPHHLKR